MGRRDVPGANLPGPLFFAVTFSRLMARALWDAKGTFLFLCGFFVVLIVVVSLLPIGYKVGHCYRAEQVGPFALSAMARMDEIPCP